MDGNVVSEAERSGGKRKGSGSGDGLVAVAAFSLQNYRSSGARLLVSPVMNSKAKHKKGVFVHTPSDSSSTESKLRVVIIAILPSGLVFAS